MSGLVERGVGPIDDLEDEKTEIVWFLTNDVTKKKTRAGKTYLQLNVTGLSGKQHRMNVWGWKDERTLEPYTFCVAETEKNSAFGFSTTSWKLHQLD